MSSYSFNRDYYIELGMCLFVPDTDRYSYPGWVLVLCGQEGRAGSGPQFEEEVKKEEGTGGVVRWWDLWSRPGIDDSVIGCGGRAHPRATAPQHQTCRIMLIYGDG